MTWKRLVLAAVGLATVLATVWAVLRQRQPSSDEDNDRTTGPAWFADVTAAIGSGAALFDYDGDGLLDILLLQNGGPNGPHHVLLHQEKDGTFRDVSADSGLDVAGYGMGVAIGDVNNDGRPDVLVTEYSGVRLFLNEGGGKFREVTRQAGLANPAWGASAAFLDFDRDGWLDLVVVNYVDYDPGLPCRPHSGRQEYCPPKSFPGRVTRLFHNKGDGTFVDVTEQSGLGTLAGPGLGVLCADFDGDGWPDIFIANDGEANRLWLNRHDGTFKEEAFGRGVAFNRLGHAEASMGVAWGDVDGDGLFDLFVTHLGEETHTLWKQRRRGSYTDVTVPSHLLRSKWRGTGFGTALADLDCDGATDLVVVNGRIARGLRNANPDLGEHWGLYAERNQVFANEGNGIFRDRSPDNPDLCGTPNVARGLAWGDVDNDGGIDLLVTTAAGPAKLYRNVVPNRGHWLIVRACDPALKRDAYGAEVRVSAGNRSWVQLVNPASSYLCSNDPRAHFGLGAATHIDAVEITWPDGVRESFKGVEVDRVVKLEKGASRH